MEMRAILPVVRPTPDLIRPALQKVFSITVTMLRTNVVAGIVRLTTTFLMSFAVLALLLLAPKALPGELAFASMTRHGATACSKCPASERLVAIGLAQGEHGWFANVKLAAPPSAARLTLTLEGVPNPIELQRVGSAWQYRGPTTSSSTVEISGVAERDDLVIFALPLTIRPTGIAVATASGDRIPESGFVRPVFPAPRHLNAVDAVLMVILLATAAFGFRRGAVTELGSLAAVVLSLGIAAIAMRPLTAVMAAKTGYATAAFIAGGILLVLCSLLSALLMPKLLRRIQPAVSCLDSRFAGIMGSLAACMRMLSLAGLVLMISIETELLHWAAPSITSSMLGSALISASKGLFWA